MALRSHGIGGGRRCSGFQRLHGPACVAPFAPGVSRPACNHLRRMPAESMDGRLSEHLRCTSYSLAASGLPGTHLGSATRARTAAGSRSRRMRPGPEQPRIIDNHPPRQRRTVRCAGNRPDAGIERPRPPWPGTAPASSAAEQRAGQATPSPRRCRQHVRQRKDQQKRAVGPRLHRVQQIGDSDPLARRIARDFADRRQALSLRLGRRQRASSCGSDREDLDHGLHHGTNAEPSCSCGNGSPAHLTPPVPPSSS